MAYYTRRSPRTQKKQKLFFFDKERLIKATPYLTATGLSAITLYGLRQSRQVNEELLKFLRRANKVRSKTLRGARSARAVTKASVRAMGGIPNLLAFLMFAYGAKKSFQRRVPIFGRRD